MTEQYQQRNINEQGDVVMFAGTLLAPNTTLNPGVQLANINESLTPVIVTLPRASDAGQNAEVTVANMTGTNGVTVAADVANGDSLVASPGTVNPITVAWGTLTVKADPANSRWVVVGQTA